VFRENLIAQQRNEQNKVATEKGKLAAKELKMGKFMTAMMLYTEAIALNPEKVFYVGRSACFVPLEEFTLALNDALEAISIDNTYRSAYYRAMDIYLAIGDLAELEEIIKKFRIIAPGIDSIDNNQVAKLEMLKKLRDDITDLIEIKNYAKCLITINEALTISPACDELYLIKLRCLIILDRFHDAEMMNNKTLTTIKQFSGQSYYEILKLYYDGYLEVCKKRVEQLLNSLPKKVKAIEDIRNKIYRYTTQIVIGKKKKNCAMHFIRLIIIIIKLLCFFFS
jgi:tetratricopeptide (TPR) repeat protein